MSIDIAKLHQVMLKLSTDENVEMAFERIFGKTGIARTSLLLPSDRVDTPEFKDHAKR